MSIRGKLLGSALAVMAAATLAAGSASATNNMGTLNPDGSLSGSIALNYNPTAKTITYAFGADPLTTLHSVTSGAVNILFDFSVVGQALTLTYADAINPTKTTDVFGASPYIYLYDADTSTNVTPNASFSYDAFAKGYEAITNTVTLQPGNYVEVLVGTLNKGKTDLNVGVFAGAAVPEPASWAMMFVGFGAIGAMMRNTRRKQAVAATA